MITRTVGPEYEPNTPVPTNGPEVEKPLELLQRIL